MSELIGDAAKRRELLKHLILQLHEGKAPEAVRTQLSRLLGQVPYGEVVEVEQELIEEGLPAEEVQRLCDLYASALVGSVEAATHEPPPGHPADTFRRENEALTWELKGLSELYAEVAAMDAVAAVGEVVGRIRLRFNALMDVGKHYSRKENLLFPFLEKHGITGPPTVMWGKHDETRGLLARAIEALEAAEGVNAAELQGVVDLVLRPASEAVSGMIYKEDNILLPMSLDTLSEAEWYEVYRGSPEFGWCLVAPEARWQPEEGGDSAAPSVGSAPVRLPSGSFTVEELTTVLNTIPFDLTFVDAKDEVRYFTQGRERIFARTEAILGRKVQFCHPPSSVATVQRILEDFRSGRQSQARFWIELGGRFLCIEYFALRGPDGAYQGCLEVSQDLTEKRALTGQRRLLTYDGEGE